MWQRQSRGYQSGAVLANTPKARQQEDVQDGVLTSFQQNHPRMKCNYCGNRGHMEDTCQKRLAHLEEKTKSSSSNSKGSNPKGWFPVDDSRKSNKKGVSGFQFSKSAWLLDEE